ncbi:hypothetical protein [Micromonospora sp. HM5-17]|jgi:hypothetical protein|uniref:hypothetical protein n=1 Tax=Micromonospora sp. HM5-17 TaxID=2487710 RepID=UPI000FA85B17|nr:hypothetical protein [Micromonospora sp. HM5-17]ROT28146.1 hypothetical protein EF879_21250 [Micromonospora sp. HM5-17]
MDSGGAAGRAIGVAGRAGVALVLASALVLGACGADDGGTGPATRQGASGTTTPPPSPATASPGPDANPLRPLAGRWTYQGDFPSDVASLTVQPDGSTVYVAEGDPLTYRGRLEPLVDGGTGAPAHRYRLVLTGTDEVGVAGDEQRSVTLLIHLADDGRSLTVATTADGPGRTFTRSR